MRRTPEEAYKRAQVSVEEWRAGMLAKGIPRVAGASKYKPTRRQRIKYGIRKLRMRLGEWVAGVSFDEW